MQKNTYKLLTEKFNISEKVLDLINRSENLVKDTFDELDDIMAYNQYKVLDAFQKNTIRDMHFGWNTGYGYDDPGRDAMRSCKSAVKGGDVLTEAEIDGLIKDLSACVNPFSCPHGRPTFIRMTRYEIEKLFKRV